MLYFNADLRMRLGRYLQSINEDQELSWQANLAHVYIACEIHLLRSAKQAVGQTNHDLIQSMMSIQNASNANQYQVIVDELCKYPLVC